MKKIVLLAFAIFNLSCSSDSDSAPSHSTLRISGENYTYDATARADVSDLLIADPNSKTVFFYVTEQLPCDAAPCRRPIGLSIRVVAPLAQPTLEGTYTLNGTAMPYATIRDYKTNSNSVSGSIQITRLASGDYKLAFSEGTVLSKPGQDYTLEGSVTDTFVSMIYDYRTATGWSN